MAEYISKEQLLAHLFSRQDEPLDVMKEIAVFPAADVAEVRRGYWDDSLDGITPYCSVCGCTHRCLIRCPIYCPNCGALMKEDEHEAD